MSDTLLNLANHRFKDIDNATTVDAFLEHYLGYLSGIPRSDNQPLLGVHYEEPNSEDFLRVKDLFRKDVVTVFDVLQKSNISNNELIMNKLSESRKAFLANIDAVLEKTFAYGKIVDSEHNIKEESNKDASGPSTVKTGDDNKADASNNRRGKKRKLQVVEDENNKEQTSKLSSSSIAENQASSALTSASVNQDGEVFFAGVANADDSFSSPQKRRSSGHVAHYKGSDIMLTLLADMSCIKDEVSSADSILANLTWQNAADQNINIDSTSSILKWIWKRADVGNNVEDTPQSFDSLENISRTVVKVSHEYLRTYQNGFDAFDNQRVFLAKENAERYRRRWDALQSVSSLRSRLLMSDIPLSCDRVPNPFGNMNQDYQSWAWLRDIYDVSTDLPIKHDFSNVEFVSCEVKEIQEIAHHLLDTILNSSSETPLSFFESVRRCASLLDQGMNCVLIDQYAAKDAASARVEAATHRALIVSTALSVFNGGSPQNQPRLSQHKHLHSFVDKMRLQFQHSKTANLNGFSGATDRAWGPILVVTKLSDMDAWEAGCREIFKDYQLEMMPYLGSDSDRMACRSYLRALMASNGGLNYVGSGLYCDRSHCHVILTNYETLLLDVHYFKDISWFAVVCDEPWGFLSNEKFHFARNQLFSSLKTRHRILSCASLSSTSYLPPPVLDADTGDASSTHASMHQLPDLMAVITVLCPFAVGLGFTHDPDQTYCTHHLQYLPNQRLYPSATSFNNYKLRKPTGLPIRSSHNVDWVEIDAMTTYYLTRLLASCTVVCSNAMVPYSALSQVISDAHVVDKVFNLCEQFHKLAPLLAWYGSAIQLCTERIDEAALQQLRNENQHVQRIDIVGSSHDASSKEHVCILITMKDFAYNIMFHDQEMIHETQYVNLKVVGTSGQNLQRIVVPDALKITEMGEESLDKPKGISGRPRGKLRNKKPVAPSTVSNNDTVPVLDVAPPSEPITDTLDDEGTLVSPEKPVKSVDQAMMDVDDTTDVVPPAVSTVTTVIVKEERVDKSANEEKMDHNDSDEEEAVDAKKDADPAVSVMVKDEVTEAIAREIQATTAVSTQDPSSASSPSQAPPKKKARLSHTEPAEMDDFTETMSPQVMKTEEDISVSAVGHHPASEPTTVVHASPAKAPVVVHTFEEEMNKSITKRAGFYFVSILQHSRQRFLGAFTSEAEAQAVFKTAFQQREEAGISSIYQVQAHPQGGVSSPEPHPHASTTTAITPMNAPKFKGRLGKDMKMSDGSFISEDYHRSLSEEDVYADLKAMSRPWKAVDRHLTDWSNVYNDPPAYGMLHAAENHFDWQDTSSPAHDTTTTRDIVSLYLPSTCMIFGQAEPRVLQSLLQDHLLEPVSAASGLIFDYQSPATICQHQLSTFVPPPSSTSTDTASSLSALTAMKMSHCPTHRVPVVHVAQDTSLAKYHACIAYNPTSRLFELFSLHPDAGIYLDGMSVRFGAVPQPIVPKSIVQLGTRSFVFCPPRPLPTVGDIHSPQTSATSTSTTSTAMATFKVDPMLLREKLMRLLQETRSRWRRGQLPVEHHLRLVRSVSPSANNSWPPLAENSSNVALALQPEIPGVGEHIYPDAQYIDWEEEDVVLKALENAEFRAIKSCLQVEVERERDMRTHLSQNFPSK